MHRERLHLVSGSAAVEPTGSRSDCVTPEGVFDLSGNLWERTLKGQKRGASFRMNAATFRVESTMCDARFVAPEALNSDDLGFRCCKGR